MQGEVLNTRKALENTNGDETLYRKLLDMFVADSATKSRRIDQARTRGDMDELAGLAHSIKGAAMVIGADVCLGLASSLEKAARADNGASVEFLSQALADELDRVRSAADYSSSRN